VAEATRLARMGVASCDAAKPEPALVIVEPPSGIAALPWRDLWSYRELLYFLARRDLSLRYRQTFLGVAWAIAQPVVTMAVFSMFFGRLAKVPSDGLPYPIFAFCGLVPWQLFSFALTNSTNSLIQNERLLTKAYFPRLLLPVASILAGVVDFAIALAVLLVLMAGYRVAPGAIGLASLPALVLLALVAALAVGIGLSAVNVRFRDVRHTLPFLTQVWFFLTPIAYPSTLLPIAWRPFYGLNPMTSVVDGFRWALLGAPAPAAMMVLVSTIVTLVGLGASVAYFLRVERSFADIV
jgi:lipopolysaccharide transport system permease protein